MTMPNSTNGRVSSSRIFVFCNIRTIQMNNNCRIAQHKWLAFSCGEDICSDCLVCARGKIWLKLGQFRHALVFTVLSSGANIKYANSSWKHIHIIAESCCIRIRIRIVLLVLYTKSLRMYVHNQSTTNKKHQLGHWQMSILELTRAIDISTFTDNPWSLDCTHQFQHRHDCYVPLRNVVFFSSNKRRNVNNNNNKPIERLCRLFTSQKH